MLRPGPPSLVVDGEYVHAVAAVVERVGLQACGGKNHGLSDQSDGLTTTQALQAVHEYVHLHTMQVADVHVQVLVCAHTCIHVTSCNSIHYIMLSSTYMYTEQGSR